MAQHRYDVFMCYNGKDRLAVLELALTLREAGIEAWLDKANLPGGVHWLKHAAQALEECGSCAVVVGPTGLGQWQEPEIQMAMDRHVKEVKEGRERPFAIIPVLLPGADGKSIPKYLTGHTRVGFAQCLDDEEAIHRLACYIRGTTPGLDPRKPPYESECPYRGLEFFDVAHAPWFHGREKLTARLIDKLRSNNQTKSPNRFLAIVGASGSGKSSLARAGLAAALNRGALEGSEQWPVLICRPGFDPCASLAVELARLGGLDLDTQAAFRDRLKDRMPREDTALDADVRQVLSSVNSKRRMVILVDQFEELFTICRDEEQRTAFVVNLVYASRVPQGPTLLLLAMRADFYGRCAIYPELARALSDCQELIGPMTQAEVRDAIEKPAAKGSCEFEPGLVDLLLKEVQYEPGSLPFLQFALKELWIRRTGRRLTTDAYRAIGGVIGALQRKADEVYAGLNAAQQQICRRVFLRLTQPGEGTEDTKRRVPLSELMPHTGSGADVEEILLDLSDAETRLITAKTEDGEEYFEVAHEALIRGWPKLRMWIEADRQALLTQRRLTEAASEWSKKNRDASFLYRGARLAAAREWAAAHADDVTSLECEFIKAGRRHVQLRRVQFVGALTVILITVTLGWLRNRAQNVEENNRMRAEGLVDQLRKADIIEVPGIVRRLDGFRRWADPLLREEDAHAEVGSSQKLHLDLALFPVDQGKLTELRDQLPLVSPAQFHVVRDALSAHRDSVAEPLWNVALDTKRDAPQRFQAACALATYTPDDKRWTQINKFVAGHLVTLEASALVAWREALRPAKMKLIAPLASIYRDPTQEKLARSFATETLADYAAENPDELFDLLADSEQFQFPTILHKLASHREKAVALAAEELRKQSSEKAREDQKEHLAKRQANAAVALLRLGTTEKVWPLLMFTPDPRARSYVIHWLSPLGADPQTIIQRLDIETDVTIRRALVLTLGEFTDMQLSEAQRESLIEKLFGLYESEPDAGLHGAVEWLLRKWGHGKRLEAVVDKLKSNEQQLEARKSTDKRQWHVNMQKQTFVIVDARRDVFEMGSPSPEPSRFSDESQHRCRLRRRFAIAAHEVTKSDFDTFLRARPDISIMNTDDWVKTSNSPQVGMTWFEATAYCNWLSEQEGIVKEQWCYEPNKQGKYTGGMKAKDKFWELTGYRLPTEAEWEFACRAGTLTSRYYGSADALLPQYAWHLANSRDRTWPAGSLEPNDWGLFDMLGNAVEWCYDAYATYPGRANEASEDMPATRPVEVGDRRVLRGGAFNSQQQNLRCAFRNYYPRDPRTAVIGFRPARTFP